MKPTLQHVPTHDGNLFDWHKKTGMVEASQLRKQVSSRVWQDACDEGFFVKSHRTSTEILFTFFKEVRCPEGDLVATEFVSYGLVETVTITVIND